MLTRSSERIFNPMRYTGISLKRTRLKIWLRLYLPSAVNDEEKHSKLIVIIFTFEAVNNEENEPKKNELKNWWWLYLPSAIVNDEEKRSKTLKKSAHGSKLIVIIFTFGGGKWWRKWAPKKTLYWTELPCCCWASWGIM